jgi:hypothetical protein
MKSSHAVDPSFPLKQSSADRRPNDAEHARGIPTHALKNKLGIILTRCELMLSGSSLDAKASADLRSIYEAAKAMADMLGNDNWTEEELRAMIAGRKP